MQAIRDSYGFSIPPNILFGFLALMTSFVAYIISSSTLGQRSLAHTWLFSGLLVLFPSEESLKRIAPTTSQTAITPKRKNISSVKDVSGLELTCKAILPGAIPLSVMTEKNRSTFQKWQALDAAVCVWMACLIALAGPFLLAWYTLYQEKIVCCDDLECWLKWWRDQLGGAGLIFVASSPPAHFMSVFLVGIAVWFWWRLVIHSTRMPSAGIFMYSPFSYINGWMTFFVTLFLLQLTNDSTTGQTRSFLGIPLSAALEEFSTRATLWVGLTGFYRPEVDESQQIVLGNILQMTHLGFAFTASLMGFAIADPLRETMHLYWGSICGDEIYIKDSTKKGKVMEWIRRKQRENAFLAVAVLPMICLSSYMVQLGSIQHFSPRALRTILGWCFICNMGILVRPLEQKYLLQALSAADDILSANKKLTVAEMQFPFQNRSQKVLSTGSQLLVFPAMVLILLTLGHGAGLPPAALSSTAGITTGIYPFGYYHSLWTEREEQEFQVWAEFQAKASAHVALHDETIIAELTATRANIDLCQQNVSFAFLTLSEDGVKGLEQANRMRQNEDAASIFRIDSASQLIPSKALIKTTFVQVLRNMQKLVKKTRHLTSESNDDEVSKPTTQKPSSQKQSSWQLEQQARSQEEFHSILQALAFHPFLTSTVILPVLDFFGLMLAFLWIMYLLWYGFRAWPERKHRRRYVLQVNAENCRVIAIQKARTTREE